MAKNSDILLIISSHHNSDEKLNLLISNLNTLKKTNIDICLATHCDYKLDLLSEKVKYLIYDKNNDFVFHKDVLSNLKQLNKFTTQDRARIFAKVSDITYERCLTSGHVFAATSNLKNSVDIAISKNYKWVLLLEYDVDLPNIDLGSFFRKRIEFLKKQKKQSYTYYNESCNNWIIPFFALIDVSLFKNNTVFMSDWCESKIKFLQTFGYRFYEMILSDIINKGPSIKKPLSLIEKELYYTKKISQPEHMSAFLLESQNHDVDFFCYSRKNENNTYNVKCLVEVRKIALGQKKIQLNFYENDIVFRTVDLMPQEGYFYSYDIYENKTPNDLIDFKFESKIKFFDFEDKIQSFSFNLGELEYFSKISTYY